MKTISATLKVVVTEKMQLEPDLINYHIHIYSKAYLEDYYEKISLEDRELAHYENLLELAQEQQAKLAPRNLIRNFTVNVDDQTKPYEELNLHFNSLENLQHFYEKIKDYPNITAAVVDATSYRQVEAGQKLLQKIVQNGKIQAD